jgi:hypothetical protein
MAAEDNKERLDGAPGDDYRYPGITIIDEGQRLRVTLPDELVRRVEARAAHKADWRALRIVPQPERFLATRNQEAKALILVGLWLHLGMIRLGEWFMGQVEANPARPWEHRALPEGLTLPDVDALPSARIELRPVVSEHPERWAGLNVLAGIGRAVAEEYGIDERRPIKEIMTQYGELFGLNLSSAGRELVQLALRYVGDDLFVVPE